MLTSLGLGGAARNPAPEGASRVSARESVGNVSVPGLSQHDYLWHLGQLGHYLATPGGAAEVARLVRPERHEDRRQDKRSDRYQRQRDLSAVYPDEVSRAGERKPSSLRFCRRKRFEAEGCIVVVHEDGTASYQGIVSCNRRSGCEHCGPRLLARDAELVQALVEHHGYDRTLMLTLTVRHHRGLALRPMRQGVANAFRAMLAHRDWRTRDCLRHVKLVRSLEVTDGPNGWHPHLHVLLLLEAGLSLEARSTLEAMVRELWRETVDRTMGRIYRPTLEHGVDLSDCNRADYLTKLGLEIADAGQSKRARNVEGRSYWQLARDWIAHGKHAGDAEAERIREYVEGMRGAKIITWSKGHKALAESLAPETTSPERESTRIYPSDWDVVRDCKDERGRDARSSILRVAEGATAGSVASAVQERVRELLRANLPSVARCARDGPYGHLQPPLCDTA